jgi:hypothetical protein
MESTVRSAWAEFATIAHTQNTAVANTAEVCLPCDKGPDREIAEKSGRPPLAIKSISRAGEKKK